MPEPGQRLCQQRVQHAGDHQSADALNQISRYTDGGPGGAVEKGLTEKISSGHQNDIKDTAADDRRSGR